MKNFRTYHVALEAMHQVAGCLARIRRQDRDLEKQLRRATQSVVLNIAEANYRRGQDRAHHFRIAAGSAAEVQAALDIAAAWGYLPAGQAAAPRATLDQVLGMLHRLTEGRGGR